MKRLRIVLFILFLFGIYHTTNAQEWSKKSKYEKDKIVLVPKELTDSLKKRIADSIEYPLFAKKNFSNYATLFIVKSDEEGELKSVQLLNETNPLFDSLSVKVVALSKPLWSKDVMKKMFEKRSSYFFYVRFAALYKKEDEKVYFNIRSNGISVDVDSTDTYPAVFVDTLEGGFYINKMVETLNFSQGYGGLYGTVGVGITINDSGKVVSKEVFSKRNDMLAKLSLKKINEFPGYIVPPHSNGKPTTGYSEFYFKYYGDGASKRDLGKAKRQIKMENFKTANKLFVKLAKFHFDDIEAQYNAGASYYFLKDMGKACYYFNKAYELTENRPIPYEISLQKIAAGINAACK